MVRFFGGVPLRTAGVTNYGADLDIARSTADEIYAQVISDLTDAYAKLPVSNGEFADRYAAQALLARVYLQQGNYASALASANDVLQIVVILWLLLLQVHLIMMLIVLKIFLLFK